VPYSQNILLQWNIRQQTMMEVWPIARHLEEFSKKTEKSLCCFIAPSIFKDSERQIKFSKQEDNLSIHPKTINNFLEYISTSKDFYCDN
jgi:hypothetical protein